MRPIVRYSVPILLAMATAACNVQESVDDAKAAVSVFHADLDAADYESIWKEASEPFRKSAPKAEFEKFLDAVHRKLGKSGKSEQLGWNANATTGGTFISLQMDTQFEKGRGQEQFVFVKNGKELELQAYNINSPALIIN